MKHILKLVLTLMVTTIILCSCQDLMWNLEKKPEIISWQFITINKNSVLMKLEMQSDSEVKQSILSISKDKFTTSYDYIIDFSSGDPFKFELLLEGIINGVYTAKIILENEIGIIVYESSKNVFSIGIEHSVGDYFQGGRIAYIFKEGDHGYHPERQNGLILADTSFTKALWGCNSDIPLLRQDIGYGASNTKEIISNCTRRVLGNRGLRNSAAGICSKLEKNGYDDWFLPSLREMEEVFKYLFNGNFNSSEPAFWTSSQLDEEEAFVFHTNCVFGNSGIFNNCITSKNNLANFVAVRYMN